MALNPLIRALKPIILGILFTKQLILLIILFIIIIFPIRMVSKFIIFQLILPIRPTITFHSRTIIFPRC